MGKTQDTDMVGKRSQTGSFVPWLSLKDVTHQLFAVYTYGKVEIYFQWYAVKPPFDDEAKRLLLLEKLNAIQGVNIPRDAITRRLFAVRVPVPTGSLVDLTFETERAPRSTK